MAVGQHYQNAYVTRNVDKAVADFERYADVRSVNVFETPVHVWTPQGEGSGVQKLAFVWVEDLNYELIQPISGDVLALYRDALPDDDRPVFHHVCHRVDDWDALMARVSAQPFPLVLEGGTRGLLEFCYVDTRPWLGHYTEYVWAAPERWAAMGGR